MWQLFFFDYVHLFFILIRGLRIDIESTLLLLLLFCPALQFTNRDNKIIITYMDKEEEKSEARRQKVRQRQKQKRKKKTSLCYAKFDEIDNSGYAVMPNLILYLFFLEGNVIDNYLDHT